jgi:cellulose synthase operon protein C
MIKVACEACSAPYELDPRRIPDKGMKMRCPKCGTSFVVTKQGTTAPVVNAAAAPAPPKSAIPLPPAPLGHVPTSAKGTMLRHRGVVANAGEAAGREGSSAEAPATARKTAIGVPPPLASAAAPEARSTASTTPPPRPAIAPPLAAAKGAFSATMMGTGAAPPAADDAADVPTGLRTPRIPGPTYRAQVLSMVPAAPAPPADLYDLSFSDMSVQDLPAPRHEVDLPMAAASEAKVPEAKLPALNFGDLDLPGRKPKSAAAAYGDLDLPRAKKGGDPSNWSGNTQRPAPTISETPSTATSEREFDFDDLPALRSAANQPTLPDLDLPAVKPAEPTAKVRTSVETDDDLPALRAPSGATSARPPTESFGDLPAVKGAPRSMPQGEGSGAFGDLPTVLKRPAKPNAKQDPSSTGGLPVLQGTDLPVRKGATDLPAFKSVDKGASPQTMSELPMPRADFDLPSPRADSASFGELDLPAPKPAHAFGALDLPAPTDNLPVPRAESRPLATFDMVDSKPPGAGAGASHAGFGDIELPTIPKPRMPRQRQASAPSADESSFGDIELDAGGDALPPSLRGDDESSFGDLELDAVPPMNGPVRRAVAQPRARPVSRGVAEEFEEIEPDEEELEFGQSEQQSGEAGYGEAQFTDGAELAPNQEMEFGISGEEEKAVLSLPPEVLRRQRGKDFEARQKAIGRRTLAIVLRLAAVLVVAVGIGASLAFTEYGVFGIYYWERWLPEAGDPQFARSAIEKAEKIAATDTYVDVKRSLRELREARRKTGLNRELLTRSLVHEALFTLRFGDDADSAAHAAALHKRLEERSFRAPGADLGRAADAARRKQWREAEALLAQARKDAKDELYAELLAGEVALAQGKLNDAEKAYAKALQLGGKARAQWGLARIASLRGQTDAEALALADTLKLSPLHIEARIAEARLSWAAGKDERGLQSLRVAIGLDPTEDDQYLWSSKSAVAMGYSLLGYIHEARGRLHLARDAYQQALSKDPYRVEALLGSGRVMLREKRYTDALARFESALSAATKSGENPIVLSGRPADAEAKLGIGRALLSLERGQEAKLKLAELSDSLPNDPELILALGDAEQTLGNAAAAEAFYRKSLDLAPARFDGYLALAQLFFKRGDAGKASEVLTQATGKVEETAEMRRMLGQSELARNRFGSAIHEFQRALELEPQDTAAMFGKAIALRKQGDLDAAGKMLDEIERRDPGYAGLSEQKGLLLESRGEYARAAESYRLALEKDPADTAMLLRYGAALVSAGNLDVAEQTLAKVVREMPNSAEAEYFIGRIAFARGRTPDALTHFDRAVGLDPARGEYHLYVARASLEMGNLGRALEESLIALDRDATLGDPYWVRAIVKLRMGAVKDALVDLGKALKLNPLRTEAYAVQGDCYEQLRKLPEAIAAYRTALEREPARALWWYKLGRLQSDAAARGDADASLRRAIGLADGVDPIPYWLPEAYSLTGENAENRGDRTTAIRLYKKYLSVAPVGAVDRSTIERKLRGWNVQLEEQY